MIKKLEAQLNRRIQSYRPISALYEHIEPNSLQVHQRHHYTHKLSYYYDHQSWIPHLNLDKDNEKDFANIQYQVRRTTNPNCKNSLRIRNFDAFSYSFHPLQDAFQVSVQY